MRAWLIRRLGGFVDVKDVLAGIVDEGEKHRILTQAVAKLYNTVGADDILQIRDGKWYYKGRVLSEGEIQLFVAEANQILGMKTWEILSGDAEYQANKKMYLLSENILHVVSGKLMTYLLDVFRTRLKSLSKGSAYFNSEEIEHSKK